MYMYFIKEIQTSNDQGEFSSTNYLKEIFEYFFNILTYILCSY